MQERDHGRATRGIIIDETEMMSEEEFREETEAQLTEHLLAKPKEGMTELERKVKEIFEGDSTDQEILSEANKTAREFLESQSSYAEARIKLIAWLIGRLVVQIAPGTLFLTYELVNGAPLRDAIVAAAFVFAISAAMVGMLSNDEDWGYETFDEVKDRLIETKSSRRTQSYDLEAYLEDLQIIPENANLGFDNLEAIAKDLVLIYERFNSKLSKTQEIQRKRRLEK
jgi:hypothetical protein